MQNVLFKEDVTHKNEEEKKEENEKKEIKQFRLKQLIKNKGESSNKSILSEDSIENIKLICLYYHGTEEACTQAMIVYDKLVSGNAKIDEETLSSEIYRKCLNLSGSNVLGCSFAYKKALEVKFKRKFQLRFFFFFRFIEIENNITFEFQPGEINKILFLNNI